MIPISVSPGQRLEVLWFSCLWHLVLISASVFALFTDDGPYSKGSKDSGGMDAALVSRRQSIPGKGWDQLLLQNIEACITLYLGTSKMGKTPKNTNFGASISRTFAGGQKWMVVTGLSEWCITNTILSCVGLLTVVAGSWEWTYSCVGLALTKKKTAAK